MAITRRDFLTLTAHSNTSQSNERNRSQQRQVGPVHHLLNRMSWGVRPSELSRAQSMGYEATLEEQLAYEQIDDSATNKLIQRNAAILSLDRHAIHRMDDSEWRSHFALIKGMVLRAVHSQRQLFERMVEFWTDHFNIPSEEHAADLVLFQREAIRKHAMGNFRDLLIATAKQPAMLTYLDNFVNYKDEPNENYARELMELHSMGVDGGYSEQDVKEVARAFTGWTIHDKVSSGFYFNPEIHDEESKTVLGHNLPSGRGIEDGLHVLAILANHPATARYICTKLCIRFVSDSPPQTLVESMSSIWQQSRGDIKSVLRHLFLSDAFKASVAQKMRRPLDFFIGAMRATSANIREVFQMEEMLQQLGQVPYGWLPPNGYPDFAAAWISTSGLLARWNVATAFTHSAHSARHTSTWEYNDGGEGISNELRQPIGTPQTTGELVDAVAAQVFGAPLSVQDRQPFLDYVTDAGDGAGSAEIPVSPHLLGQKLGSLYGLMLASPLYQWR
ncbi:MAG: DUF1800 domain-containing protein [Chloroflexota bacterium]